MYKTNDTPGAGNYECLTCKSNLITLKDGEKIPECSTPNCKGDIWARVYNN
ncbi:zinc ribbon-containing protein [Companilactobacillus sp. DQM5]|uniref:zinc ribbon-containing protein n=1 Tax=Companilactobacillus sp. DQM5 TaxID=3463359 RepID=UPI004058F382